MPRTVGRLNNVVLLFSLLIWFCASAFAIDEGREQIELNGHTFTLPAGFTIELAATSPLVDRPITADFDEQGRLYVSDSSGSNDKVQKQLEEKPHRVVRLEDTDGDGRFDHSTVFADKLMFPEGTMWYDGSLYVAAPPSIWKLTDTDGDGVADRREEWFQGKTLTGCANDLHGPYLGPDGWIYWCKGAFAEQTYERPGKPPLVTKASHIFRARPDGSQIEPVMTGGMDNPVDLVFTPGGERIFTTTFLVHPGGGLRDGLIHAVYGGVYGKVHAVLDGHPRTSPDVMPVLTHLGPAAPCGLTRYESDVFGGEYQDNLFACLFNMQKVTRHVLTEDGATFKSRDEDFVVSSNRDFHPTDVLEDADGSLLIVDTGGWYKLCCPTSQLVKPDILGAIYRVRRSDAKRVDDPRGLKIAWSKYQIASYLGDARPAVRRRAMAELVSLDRDAIRRLDKFFGKDANRPKADDIERMAVNGVWTLARIGTDYARRGLRAALNDRNAAVRQAAIHSLSLLRDREALPQLLEILRSGALQNRRAAAEAIGRIGDAGCVASLLNALDCLPPNSNDAVAERTIEHSLIFAIIEIDEPVPTMLGLQSQNPTVQRAALIALDQMLNGALIAETVTPFLNAGDSELRRTAAWIAGHHPEWAEALAGYLRERLGDEKFSLEDRAELAAQLGGFASSTKIQELLATRLVDSKVTATERKTILDAMQRSGLKEVPVAWINALAKLVSAAEKQVDPNLLVTIRALHIARPAAGPVRDALSAFTASNGVEEKDRLAALAEVPGGLDVVSPQTFDWLITQLDSEGSSANRPSALEVLTKARLTSEQLTALARKFSSAGPMEIDRLLSAFEQSTDPQVGMALLTALNDAAVIPSLRVEMIKPRLAKYPTTVQAEAEKLYARLTADMAAQRAKLEELAESLPPGDIRRGQAIFNSTKAACATCHAIGYLGGKIGPDLTRIGQVRTGRDLLESILYPSASFVRSYEPVAVVTTDGLTYNGLLKQDSADQVVLVKSATEEIRIARENIDEMRPGTVSIMPQGLDKQLSQQELADLVAFLQGCK